MKMIVKALFLAGIVVNGVVSCGIFLEMLDVGPDTLGTVIVFGYGIMSAFSLFGRKEAWERLEKKTKQWSVVAVILPAPAHLFSVFLYGLGTFERAGQMVAWLMLGGLVVVFLGGIIGAISIARGHWKTRTERVLSGSGFPVIVNGEAV
ncbi:MAG: hypothetical protein WCJ25_03840 [Candidatus Moraniibacteriota bacterium]